MFRRESGRWMPGVSIRITRASGRCTIPRMRFRVVCATGVTIDTFAPTSALTSVLLPAFGLPTTATKADLNGFVDYGMGRLCVGIGWEVKSQPNLQNGTSIEIQNFNRLAVRHHFFVN